MQRGEKNIEHFMEKSTDKKSKLSQGKKGKYYRAECKEEKVLTQQSEEIGKNGGRNGWRRGRKLTKACLGSFFDLWFQSGRICD